MIAFEELLGRFVGLDRRELARWVENRWVLPERRNKTWIFHEIDVARVELILEVRQRGYSYRETARLLADRCGVKISHAAVHNFVTRHARTLACLSQLTGLAADKSF